MINLLQFGFRSRVVVHGCPIYLIEIQTEDCKKIGKNDDVSKVKVVMNTNKIVIHRDWIIIVKINNG